MITSDLLAQVRRIQVRTSRLVTSVLAGGYTSVFRGAGIEFDEVREFTEGDDVRSVDWNVTARTGRPHVKRFVEERELTVLFALDLSASMGFGSLAKTESQVSASLEDSVRLTLREAAATFLACLALAAARNNDKAGMVAFSDRIEMHVPARKGAAHVSRLVREALIRVTQGKGTDIANALEHVARVQRKRAVIFVISDFLTGDFARPLRLLAKKHDVVLVMLSDPRMRALPKRGLFRLRDLESGCAQWIDAASSAVREFWIRRFLDRRATVTECARRAGATVLPIDLPEVRIATRDLLARTVADAIVAFFRRRELQGARR